MTIRPTVASRSRQGAALNAIKPFTIKANEIGDVGMEIVICTRSTVLILPQGNTRNSPARNEWDKDEKSLSFYKEVGQYMGMKSKVEVLSNNNETKFVPT